MAKPAARKSDSTLCPVPGHGINFIVEGSPDVIFDGLPAARQGDKCSCGSTLSTGVSSTVFINGRNAAIIDTAGTHGNVIIGGSSTVIIGDSFTPAPFTPLLPLSIQKTYGQSFSVSDRETGKPLAMRAFIATVDGLQTQGVTDANGVAHVRALSENAKIYLHIKFMAPARILNELSEEE
ncbi:PAAR domain-containing protein [Pseudomonas chlororaphis]|uniref:PAAR domain-containing protein n=1 Tax=Pseudomonas chlororaphis TaxID=587753 RepID=UPI00209A8374|nr:PAAR domain-containing protein [Pseudomonas chlororaphis]MCO7610765.1 PAAR domain-containing protein [Pseudomonas chlororaphis]